MNNKKLFLRPLEKGDINRYYLQWVNDDEVTKCLTTIPPVSMNDLKKYVDHMTSSDRRKIFAIIVNEVHIGNITLNDIDNKTANVGIMIGEKTYWGQGYGTEAIKKLIELAHNMGLTKLWAGVKKENTASYKAFIKAGFHTTSRKEDSIRLDFTQE